MSIGESVGTAGWAGEVGGGPGGFTKIVIFVQAEENNQASQLTHNKKVNWTPGPLEETNIALNCTIRKTVNWTPGPPQETNEAQEIKVLKRKQFNQAQETNETIERMYRGDLNFMAMMMNRPPMVAAAITRS